MVILNNDEEGALKTEVIHKREEIFLECGKRLYPERVTVLNRDEMRTTKRNRGTCKNFDRVGFRSGAGDTADPHGEDTDVTGGREIVLLAQNLRAYVRDAGRWRGIHLFET